jgi:hypothetical protein
MYLRSLRKSYETRDKSKDKRPRREKWGRRKEEIKCRIEITAEKIGGHNNVPWS